MMNEAQTKHDLIEPALREAGWGIVEDSRLRLEFPITQGRLIGQNRRAKPLFTDYVLEYKNRRIGIIEAKARDKYYTDSVYLLYQWLTDLWCRHARRYRRRCL